MKYWIRTLVVAVGAATVVGMAASASGAQQQTKAAAAELQLAAPPTYQPSAEMKYVPITPCRVLDTRGGTGTNGTPFVSKETRTYYIGGTFGFAPQGGKTGGCGIPVGATSITGALTAVAPTNDGFVRLWPNGESEPGASLFSYIGGQGSTSTGLTFTINSASAYALKIRNYGGPTDMVLDVTGYFVKPMAGMISSGGAPYSGSSRILSAARTSTGVYEVQFDRNVRYCSATATAYVSSYYTSTTTWFDSARPDTVRVSVWNSAGTATDQYFYISVEC